MTPRDGGPGDPLDAVAYHERTKHSPRSLREDDFRLDYPNKPRPYKAYEDLPTVGFPGDHPEPSTPALEAIARSGADPGSGAGTETETPLDFPALASLCFHSNGITKRIERRGDTIPFRAAACTGKLYHVDLYAVTGDLPAGDGGGDDGTGLDAGVYHFDPRSEAFDVLRTGDHRGLLATAAGDDRIGRAPVTFVATSTWWRNAWKYRERTFRHAFWDSGTILANLLATAHALGHPAGVLTGFADDPVARLLGIDPREEAPLELVPVGDWAGDGGEDGPGGAAPGPGDGSGSPAPGGEGSPASVEPIDPATVPYSAERRDYPAIHRAWSAGVLPDGDAAGSWRSGLDPGDRVGTREAGDGRRVALDPVDRDTASGRPLSLTIRRRGSCREYERDDVSFRKLSTVLDRAFRGVPTDVTGTGSDDPALALNDAYLLVNGVDGVAPGSYHYHPDAGELERLEEGEFREEAAHLALDQRLGGDAAVCAYFLTDLEAAVDRLGDRGYRVATLEAAVTAGRLYLAAYAHRDLGATGLTFYDDEVTAFFSPRAAGQTPTFLLTIGRPA